MRGDAIEEGRSINLALSARGIHALARVGLDGAVLARAIPMRGRIIHPVERRRARSALRPHGGRGHPLASAAAASTPSSSTPWPGKGTPPCASSTAAPATTCAAARSPCATSRAGGESTAEAPVVIGADGAASAVRLRACMLGMRMDYSQEYLDHGYKELTIPPAADGGYRMERNALHIWPRGGFMMIALPNLDGSFTCTLFLAQRAPPASTPCARRGDVRRFFADTSPTRCPCCPTSKRSSSPTRRAVWSPCAAPLARRRAGGADRRRGPRHRARSSARG